MTMPSAVADSISEPIPEPIPEVRFPAVRRRAPDVVLHATLLGMAVGVVFLSAVLNIAGDRQVLIPILDLPLPGVCTYQRWFGVPCPGCGLTRCFISIAHGDLVSAWRFNPAGLLGFLLVAAQIPYRTAQLIRLRFGLGELRLGWLGQPIFWTFLVLLIAQWVVRTFL